MIYYLKHLLQDMDEEKMLSRALISYIRDLVLGLSRAYQDHSRPIRAYNLLVGPYLVNLRGLLSKPSETLRLRR